MYLEENTLQGEVRPHNCIKNLWVVDEDLVTQDIIDESLLYLSLNIQVNYFDDLIELDKRVSNAYYAEPDLILIDLDIDSSSYEELIHNLKSNLPNCNIIIWNNDNYNSQRKNFMQHGATDVLRKPFDVQMTMRLLKTMSERYLN